MEKLKKQIEELKQGRTLKQLKIEDRKAYYKVQGLSSELSELKAIKKGQLISKKHLVEYKPLIIWMLKNKASYKGYLNVRECMTEMLNYVETNQVVYLTERGIKGIITSMALRIGLDNSFTNLIEQEQIDLSRECTMNNRELDNFQSFRLNRLMA